MQMSYILKIMAVIAVVCRRSNTILNVVVIVVIIRRICVCRRNVMMIVLIVLSRACRTAIRSAYCSSWRWEGALFVMLGYRYFQWRIYHIRILNGFVALGWWLKWMICVAFKQNANTCTRKTKCAAENRKNVLKQIFNK